MAMLPSPGRLSTSRPAHIVLHSHLGPSPTSATPLEPHQMYMDVTQGGISFEDDTIQETVRGPALAFRCRLSLLMMSVLAAGRLVCLQMSRYGPPRSALSLIQLCETPHQAQPAGIYEALLAVLRELRRDRPDTKYRRRPSRSGTKRTSNSLQLSAGEAVGPAP